MNGYEKFIKKMQEYLIEMQFPKGDKQLTNRRWRAFLNKMAVCNLSEKCRDADSFLYVDEFNVLNVRQKK